MALRNHFKLTIFTAWTLLNSDSFRIHLQTRAVFQLETYADGQLDFLLVHYMRVFTKQLLIDQARDRKELLFFKLLQRNGFLSVLSDYAVRCYMGLCMDLPRFATADRMPSALRSAWAVLLWVTILGCRPSYSLHRDALSVTQSLCGEHSVNLF